MLKERSEKGLMNNIAFVGSLRSGKSTMADALIALQSGRRKLSFAAALKDEVADSTTIGMSIDLTLSEKMFSIFRAEMDDPEKKFFWRNILQWWGTELRRNRFGDDYWVKIVEKQLSVIRPLHGVLIDDCRFDNEYRMLRGTGAFFFVALESNPDLIKDVHLEHQSEQEWQNFEVDLILPWIPVEARIKIMKSEGLI